MENRDYNEPERDYYTSEENQYTNYSQTYTNQQYNSQQYNNQQYNSQYYTDMGGVKRDSQGMPMKNYFAIQMVFAIVEILLCCFSPTSMVLAIVALVFAIQANTAYVHGKEIDFKVKSKVSNILLIIGGAFMALSIISSVLFTSVFMMSWDTIIEEGIDGDFSGLIDELERLEDEIIDEEDAYMGEQLGDGDVPLVEGYEKFILNGTEYALPMSYEDFARMGFVLEFGYESAILESGEYELVIIYDEKENMVGSVRFYNDSNVVKPIEQCIVDFISFDNNSIYGDETPLDLVFGGGCTFESSYEDIEAFMGTPTYRYIDNDEYSRYENYTWYYSDMDVYEMLDLTFYNGVISNVSFESCEY